jgi:2-polyprenyl-3-methyl-5-hydroxy-6-metoxy-1,4-benzoquinol methylase
MTTHTCPICGHAEVFEAENKEYYVCTNCRVLRTKYSYDLSLYDDSYAKNYVEYVRRNQINIPLQLFRVGLVSRWLKPKEGLLDIGCGIGEFIHFAEKYYTCVGFEPNPKAIERKRCKAKVYSTLVGSVPRFRCVTMFDVLEHIQKPKEFLRELVERHLLPGGVLAITTPNIEAVDSKNWDKLIEWKHYKPREHLFLYNEQGLEILLESAGFSVIHWGREESDIRPDNPNGDILTCVAQRNP